MDVAVALNAELLDMQAAGCDVIQIDEPAMTRYHEKVRPSRRRALDRCLEGVTVPTIVHLCYGYPGRVPRSTTTRTGAAGDADEDAHRRLLGRVRAQRVRPGDPEGCEGRLVMFGCVDPGDTPLEPVGRRSSTV